MKKIALCTLLCAGTALLAAGCTETTGTMTGATKSSGEMSSGEVRMPAGLTSEEQLIWNSLSVQAKRDAIAYMEAGGSFKEFVAV